ncbi:hypothetical protein GCM10023093_25060 [Nemorincola caseinilytica]|uniref:Uncharacterized protein n=2 Tax=Nemorincola caseinilytica TaxID=2054315 RepID=A0ABP8NMW1_9BACT
MDYLRHKKTFHLCSFELDCSGCYNCHYQKYTVRIKNVVDKKITGVYYTYYSESRNRLVTKEGEIIGGVMDPGQIGHITMCMPNGKHWAISKIVYDDESSQSFVVNDRLDQFVQEPDECDCNKQPNNFPDPNIGRTK